MLGSPKTVLLVEDEALIRMGTCAMLEDSGYLVLEAADADDAKSILSQHPEIVIVVTDVQMPGSIDGLELANFISRHHTHIRVLVTSGRTDAQDALSHGATSYISKPYTAATIERALGQLNEPRSA